MKNSKIDSLDIVASYSDQMSHLQHILGFLCVFHFIGPWTPSVDWWGFPTDLLVHCLLMHFFSIPSPPSNHKNLIFMDDKKKRIAEFHGSKHCGENTYCCSDRGVGYTKRGGGGLHEYVS